MLKTAVSPGGSQIAKRALFWIIAIYIGACLTMMLRSGGLPYGIDGNETFSDAVHAKNLSSFSWSTSYGLTDESYGLTSNAHPYIHSHQGNFPRLFTYFIYILGAHDVELQVAITALTVGLAGVIFAFIFFARVSNALFAFVACLVYMSDYFLFGQWHLNTYRVWHCFFFFSSLLCAVSFVRRPTRLLGALTLLNFLCLCYWEFVFATFVLTAVAIFSAIVGYRHPRRVAVIWGLEIGGAFMAAAVLLSQLVAYMGVDAVRKDIFYTMHARNSAEEHSFTMEVTAFYAQHKVLFWPNYLDASQLRRGSVFFDSLLKHHLEYYTPWLGLAMVFTAAGWPVALLSGRVLRRFPVGRFVVGLISVCFLPWWLSKLKGWFDWEELPLWRSAGWSDGVLHLVLFVAIVGIFALLIVARPDRVVGLDRSDAVWPILWLLVSGIAAFAVTYFAFTGYVYSGYLNRQTPLLVFISDMLLALVFYTFVAPLLAPWPPNTGLSPSERQRYLTTLFASGAFYAIVLLILATGWLRLQATYLKVVPIDGYSFIKRLSKAPFKGHSFVVSTYAAPVAVETGSWAYMEPVLFGGNVTLTARGFKIERDDTYKWFADLDKENDYQKPEYALIVERSDWNGDYRRYFSGSGNSESQPKLTDTIGLLRRATEPFSAFFHDAVADGDFNSPKGQFAIVKLDWDYPAYLRPLPMSESLTSKTARRVDQRWEVEIQTIPEATKVGTGVDISSIATERESLDLETGTVRDDYWRNDLAGGEGGGQILHASQRQEAWMHAIVTGDDLKIDFRAGPHSGRARVAVNDLVGEINLDSKQPRIESIRFNADEPEGKLTGRAVAVPGQYVALSPLNGSLRLTYQYAHQESLPEENTRVDLIGPDDAGTLRVLRSIELLGKSGIPVDLYRFRKENPDTVVEHVRIVENGDSRTYVQWLSDYLSEHPEQLNRHGVLGAATFELPLADPDQPAIRRILLPMPTDFDGPLYALVRPGTRTKLGPAYPSNIVEVIDPKATYGAVRLRMRIGDRPAGTEERLLTSGAPAYASLLYLRYGDDGRVMFGLTDGHRLGLLSNPLTIDKSDEHVVEVSMGEFYPTDAGPAVPESSARMLQDLANQIWVRVDGKEILSAPYSGPPAPWRTVRIGESSADLFDHPVPFSGQLAIERFWPDGTRLKRSSVQDRMLSYGRIRMKVKFPSGHTLQSDPLVTTGETGSGDFVYVYYCDPQHIKIGFDHWGVHGFMSKPIAMDFDRSHEIAISIGSLFPPDGDILYANMEQDQVAELKERVLVAIDGSTVLDGESNCYDSPPGYVTIGRNEIGGSTAGPAFTGEILSVNRVFSIQGK